MQQPAFPENRHHRRLRFQQGRQLRVILRLQVGPTGRSKGRHFRVLEGFLFRQLEKDHVPRIRSRPAALNVINPERIQQLRHEDLVFSGKGNALTLRAIAQSGVIDQD